MIGEPSGLTNQSEGVTIATFCSTENMTGVEGDE